eukprot:130083_1
MSKNKTQIGRKLKYKHQSKWYKAEVIEKTNNKIAIKVWTSIFKPKIITFNKPEWKQLISSKHKNDTILRFDDNKIFPDWVSILQIVIIDHKNALISNKTSQPIIAKIIDYKDGQYIKYCYISDNNFENPYNNIPQKLLTQTIKSIDPYMNNSSSLIDQPVLRIKKVFTDQILYPYYNAFENDEYHDIIVQLNNRKLIKKLSHPNKYTNQMYKPKMIENNSYICNSKLQYGCVMKCKLFPYDINKLLLSFVAQKMIYICPPTPCCKLQTVPPSWQFAGGKLAVIGCKFVLNRDLLINGFELNHIEMLGLYKHTICLSKDKTDYIATQLILKEHRTDAQYIFDENLELKKDEKYTVKIKVKANVPCYQWHETPLNMKCYILCNEQKDKDVVFYDWKCFKSISWVNLTERGWANWTPPNLSWFPHFAFLLPQK